MKFLIFNLAVAAALVFLFTADRGDVQKMAGQVHDAATDIKGYAERALNKSAKIASPNPVATPEPAREPAPKLAAEKPAPVHVPVQTPVKSPVKSPVISNAKPRPSPTPPVPHQASRVAEAIPPAPPISLKPAVAQRRQEVLDGVPPTAPTNANGAPKLQDGTKLMTAADRRKELLSLAEEMELLYARSISR